MKKLLKVITCLALCISLTGCGSKKGSEEFAKFIKTIPNLLVAENTFDLNFLFDKPEDYGIKSDLYTLGFTSLKDYKKQDQELQSMLDELDEYDYDKLDDDQKIVYDLLKDTEDDWDLDIEDQYYLTTNYFDTGSGIQAQLPMSLWNYELKSQKSYDSFKAILQQLPTLMKQYTYLEKTRQEKGYGMSKTYMEDVIKNLHTIATTDQSYIMEAIKAAIDNADFINDKQSAKEELQKLFDENFTSSFAQAEKDLTAISVKTKGEGELASYTGGKDYYEAMVTSSAGVDTIDEYTKYLEKQESKITNRMVQVMKDYPELKEYLSDSDTLTCAMNDAQYTTLTSAKEVLNYLEKEVNTGKNFPKIKDLEYVMNTFPEAMKDTTNAAAAYFVSAYDNDSGTNERMILNGTFLQSDFTTFAHESFPGHMYQNNYFKTVDHDILRDLLGSNTYSEGWATYIQDKACDYTDNPGICHLNTVNDQMVYIYVLDLDKQIHYDGITRQEAYDFMSDTFGLENEEDLSTQYEQLLENPGVFANYYIGLYKILDLKTKAIDSWGDEYSEYRFHKAILDLGPLPMDLLEKYMELS